MTNIYDIIEPLPYDMEYWTNNRPEIIELIKKNNFKKIVEVGCWIGFTTIEIAKNLPEDGFIVAIDIWEPFDDGISTFSSKQNFSYYHFLSNVIHEGVQDKIITLKYPSNKAAQMLKIKADLIYIDGAHDTKTVYDDLSIWYPKLSENGILCGDDWFISATQEAIKIFAEEKKLKIVVPEAKNYEPIQDFARNQQAFWYLTKNDA